MSEHERDEQGWVIAAYQSCDPGQYEGATDLYCRHLEAVHGCPPELIADLAASVSEWGWLTVDRLHRTYLEGNTQGHGCADKQ